METRKGAEFPQRLCCTIASSRLTSNRFPLGFFVDLAPILGQPQRAFGIGLEPISQLPVCQPAVLEVILGVDAALPCVCGRKAAQVIVLCGVVALLVLRLTVQQVHQRTTNGMSSHFVVAGDQCSKAGFGNSHCLALLFALLQIYNKWSRAGQPLKWMAVLHLDCERTNKLSTAGSIDGAHLGIANAGLQHVGDCGTALHKNFTALGAQAQAEMLRLDLVQLCVAHSRHTNKDVKCLEFPTGGLLRLNFNVVDTVITKRMHLALPVALCFVLAYSTTAVNRKAQAGRASCLRCGWTVEGTGSTQCRLHVRATVACPPVLRS